MQVSHRFLRILFIGLITLQSMACQKEEAAQRTEDKIRLNQIGYYPQAEKKAVVMSEQASTFTVQDVGSGEVVWKGTLGENRVNPYSKKISRIADFSGLQQQGSYVLQVDGMGRSYPFQIREQVHLDLTKAALKGFFTKEHPQRSRPSLPVRGRVLLHI
jgi:endoglucanase